ncbi:hypothetical protein Pmar_PMAR000522, partial [Perkinsus marinus ATCC 50983]
VIGPMSPDSICSSDLKPLDKKPTDTTGYRAQSSRRCADRRCQNVRNSLRFPGPTGKTKRISTGRDSHN